MLIMFQASQLLRIYLTVPDDFLYTQEVLISLNGHSFLKIHISGNKCLVLFHAYQGNSCGFEEDLQFSNEKSWP